MFKTKRARDQAACALIVTIPIVLIVVVFCAIFAWSKDSNNPSNPDYVAPEIRSYSSREACLDSLTQQLDMTTTRIYMPLASNTDYITALRSEGNNSETTIWGLVSKYGFSCTEGQTTLPQPYKTVTLGPSTLTYDYTFSKVTVHSWYAAGWNKAYTTITYQATITADCKIESIPAGSSYHSWSRGDYSWTETERATCTRREIWPQEQREWVHGVVPFPDKISMELGGFVNATAVGRIAVETAELISTDLIAAKETAMPAGVPNSTELASATRASSMVTKTTSKQRDSATTETAVPNHAASIS